METKPKRQAFQPYVPVHRRNQAEITAVPSPPPSVRASPKEDTEVKRRGRGQFRAPLTEDNNNEGISNSSKSMREKTKASNHDMMPIEKLTERVKNLATEASDSKDDWEEEWEASANHVTAKVKTKTPAKPKPKEPSIYVNGKYQ
ncbi:hypothetical protein MBANPS3_010583 [Mucor bainieri]